MDTREGKTKVLIVDFSRVLIFPVAEGIESLNKHHETLAKDPAYKLFDHFWLNHELLDYLEKVSKHIPVYIFTDGKLHELPEVVPHLKDIFTEKHTVESLGLNKKQSESYVALAARFGVKPGEIVFIDDKAANVEAAKRAGVHAIHYTSAENILSQLDKLLQSTPSNK
jgi:HAD superfamily hydrolase (TIGR01509 family)